jgi:nucleotide-binding universal stress UspA family protein
MSKQPPVRHILVLVDGTDTSSRAVDLAIELACAMRTRLTAMALVETETLRQLLSAQVLTTEEMGEFEEGLGQSARRQLAEAVERAKHHGISMEHLVGKGNSEVVVPAEVQARGVDLIVVGGFDTNHASHDLMVRQRLQLVDHAPCPVLVGR